MPPVAPIRPGVGQRSVWDFPRPPALEPVGVTVRIAFGGLEIARTEHALQVLETSHPPSVYLPPDAFIPGVLQPHPGSSACEWKGRAVYFDVVAGGRRAEKVAWAYPDPTPAFRALKDHVAVYAGPMDACWIGGERVTPQPGGFYGGWVTSAVVGPFKGEPGTWGW
ncbi:DUF427 domain-containing protein [Rubrivirga sp. IMCC43871]|uniref:DUF427 domain-containing protein n=1 Tax=Rubrivirga sp. IMCC43871 TaxID=3391575 RepID=UPI00398FC452